MMRRSLGADLARVDFTDLMVVIGDSGVENRKESCLAWEFGLGGTRWHEVEMKLGDVRS
jgi:hypothetical protein